MDIDQDLYRNIAIACNILFMEGHGDITLGHVTARAPGSEQVYMKPKGRGLEEITPKDIIVIDFNGEKIAGDKLRHSEYPIHTEIYKARDDINCVIHTHPPYATALAASEQIIRPVSHEGVLFAELPVFTETSELIVTHEQGKSLAQSLGSSNAVLMLNHGIVVAGDSVEEAVVYAILLEKAAKMQLYASSFGSYHWSPEAEVMRKKEQIYHKKNVKDFWDYYVRKLKRDFPDWGE